MRIIELWNESVVKLIGLDGIAMYVSGSIESLFPASGYYRREVDWVGFYFYACKQQYCSFVSSLRLL